MNKILHTLNSYSYGKLLLIFSVLALAINLISANILVAIGVDIMKNTQFDSLSDTALFFGGVFFSPIIETFIFQYLIIEMGIGVYQKIKDKMPSYFFYFPGILSALSFGFSHYYNVYYIVMTILAGLLFAVYYYYTRKRFGISMAIVLCFVVHFINNLIAFIGQVST